MVIGFVTKSGIDSANGLTLATAKLTMTAAEIAGLDPIRVFSGNYPEDMGNVGTTTFLADGRVTMDSGLTIKQICNNSGPTMKGFIFRKYTAQPVGGQDGVFQNCSGTFIDCTFDSLGTMGRGFRHSGGPVSFDRCVFIRCSAALDSFSGGVSKATITSCTFLLNGNAARAVSFGELLVKGCTFKSNSTNHINISDDTEYVAGSDGNIIDFSTGQCLFGGVAKTTLPAWQAVLSGGKDGSSVDKDPEFIDGLKDLFGPRPGSPMLTDGLPAVAGGIVGAFNRKLTGGIGVMEGASINRNPTIWNDPSGTPAGTAVVSSSSGTPDLIQNASDNWILAPGKTKGSITHTFNFVTALLVGRVFKAITRFYPLHVDDNDSTDTNPNRLKHDVSINVGAGFGPFTSVEPDSHPADPTTGFRDVSPATPVFGIKVKTTLTRRGVAA